MKKLFLSLSGLVFSLVPTYASAACSPNGTTVIYINGIETTQQEASNDTALLNKRFLQYGGSSDVRIITGYNPTHLDGFGDELESITQAFNIPVSDYDLDTLLTEIASKLTTKKLLLVGHSQGTFYTNELYDYFVKNGLSSKSVAVYNLATPADHVAGGGTYLTSANDKAINYVREMDAAWNAPQALPANIIIGEEPGYANNVWGGHSPRAYFDGAPARIISDIESALGKLSASDAKSSDSCFTPPRLGLAYKVEKALFDLVDPAVASVDYAAIDARSTIASVADNANDILHTAFSDVIFSVIPRPTVQNAAGVFAVEKALYGSSLSVADYEALVQGEDIPEVRTLATNPAQKSANDTSLPAVQSKPSQSEEKPAQSVPAIPPKPPVPSVPMPAPMQVAVSPGFGGGSSPIPSSVEATMQADPEPAPSSSPQPQPDQPPTVTNGVSTTTAQISTTTESSETASSSVPITTTTPPFSITSPLDQANFSTSTITFSGTTSPQALVLANFATTSTSTIADRNGSWQYVLILPAGTTTVSFGAVDGLGNLSATSTRTVNVMTSVGDIPATAFVTDTFDQVFSDWNNYLPNWTNASWDTNPADCYSGNCIAETSGNQQYENIKYGTPRTSGSFVVYFRNDRYSGEFGVGVCTNETSSQCHSPSAMGGANALLFTYPFSEPFNYRDNIWHSIYFAFRDGPQYEEYCGLVDADDPANCAWTTGSTPSGTTYSGVVLFTSNGLNPNASFHWDELGAAPVPPAGP